MKKAAGERGSRTRDQLLPARRVSKPVRKSGFSKSPRKITKITPVQRSR